MSFYRIYRPKTFEEIDNESVRSILTGFLSTDIKDLPHAFLFAGSKGTGKTTAARIIAKLFNCEKLKKGKDGGPCGICDQCTMIASGTNTDVVELDAASHRGIDEIRELRDRIGFSPSLGLYTVYIIDEVHMLTTEAFNALLKTLEEPPRHAVFILATTDLHKVPSTIQSRCMKIMFSKASDKELTHALERIIKAEKIEISSDAVEALVSYADGSFRDAVKMLEQVWMSKKPVTIRSVQSLLSMADNVLIAQCVTDLIDGKREKILQAIDTIVKNGGDVKVYMTGMLKMLQTKYLESLTLNSNTSRIKQCIETVTRAYAEMRISPIAELPLQIAVVELSHEEHDQAKPTEEKSRPSADGLITREKLMEYWKDIIEELKPHNHSIAGVMRSAFPESVEGSVVTIATAYTFHKEKLSETKTLDVLSSVLKKLFGEKVKVQIVLKKKI